MKDLAPRPRGRPPKRKESSSSALTPLKTRKRRRNPSTSSIDSSPERSFETLAEAVEEEPYQVGFNITLSTSHMDAKAAQEQRLSLITTINAAVNKQGSADRFFALIRDTRDRRPAVLNGWDYITSFIRREDIEEEFQEEVDKCVEGRSYLWEFFHLFWNYKIDKDGNTTITASVCPRWNEVVQVKFQDRSAKSKFKKLCEQLANDSRTGQTVSSHDRKKPKECPSQDKQHKQMPTGIGSTYVSQAWDDAERPHPSRDSSRFNRVKSSTSATTNQHSFPEYVKANPKTKDQYKSIPTDAELDALYDSHAAILPADESQGNRGGEMKICSNNAGEGDGVLDDTPAVRNQRMREFLANTKILKAFRVGQLSDYFCKYWDEADAALLAGDDVKVRSLVAILQGMKTPLIEEHTRMMHDLSNIQIDL